MEKERAVNGKQPQINKKWSQLKSGQKDWIAQQMKLEYAKFAEEHNRVPNKDEKEALISIAYQLIGEKGIWIAYHDIKKRFL